MNRPIVSKGRVRLAWFVDLEMLVQHLEWLPQLRDEVGLTTVVPESHLSHTSGFRSSVVGPLEDWRNRPTLKDHREVFGVSEPAMAVLPGIVGGVDDGPLLAVIEACRREGLELWGHAGVWCYGGEMFREFAALDLFGRALTPGSLPWGTMFCPTHPEVHAFVVRSLADAAARYDLDGWFLDHARYPSPGHPASLLACGCAHCASVARASGVDFDVCRADVQRLAAGLPNLDVEMLRRYAAAGPAGVAEFLSDYPGVTAWFDVRAGILADRLAGIGRAIQSASGRAVEFGSDVFPPSVALLGGHSYAAWTRTATYLTGGFGPKIGWSTVTRVTAEGLAALLVEGVPGLMGIEEASASMMALLGAPDPNEAPVAAFRRELRAMSRLRPGVPVYPPIPAGQSTDSLRAMCQTIVAEGLDGAMLSGLERYDADQRTIIRQELAARLRLD